jgi:P4 family phage/plasmid primase-like protien
MAHRGDFMIGPFARSGAKLILNGWSIVPIPRGSKGPVVKNWQTVALKTKGEFEAFLKGTHKVEHNGRTLSVPNVRDGDGIGINTRATPAIDIDCLDESIALAMESFIRDNLGDAPLRIGMAPKRLLVFQAETPFSKIISSSFIDPKRPTKADGKPLCQRIEVLGEGQQFVAYHIHPETGKPYTWPDDFEEPLHLTPADLPTLDEDQARGVCREFERLCLARGWTKVEDAHENTAGAGDLLAVQMPPDESDEEVARVKSALEHISPDCSRAEYLEVLAALKWAGWICAEDMARDWAEGSKEGKFDEKDFNRDWKSLKQERGSRTITLGSLFHQAKAGGWDASRGKSEEEERIEFEGLVEEIGALEPTREARKAIVQKIAEAGLDVMDETELLHLLAKKMKMPVGEVRRAVAQARRNSREHGEPTHANYAKALLSKIEDETGVDAVGVEGKLWVYETGEKIWLGKAPNEFEVEVARAFDGMENCSRRNDYLAVANHAYSVSAAGREDFFDAAPVGLACKERFYTIADGEIRREELNQHHRQRVLSEVAPKVMATPLWDKLMASAFAGDHEREQELLLEEYAGACLLGFACKYEKVLFMKGKGRAGKGTIMKILCAMLPASAIGSISPEVWSREYYLADLAAKRINVVGELTDETAIDAAAFKRVTGRDSLTARRPNHMPFQFRNQAGHIFNANNFVFTRDHSEAFYTRWLMMEFRNSMIGRDDDIDPDLAEKVIADELPGVAAKFLQGAKRLAARGHFLLTGPHHKLMQEWRHRSSTLMEFIYDREACVLGSFPNHTLHRAEFYSAYAAWCRESNRKPLGKQKLYDEVESDILKAIGVKFATKTGGVVLIRGLVLRNMIFPSEVADGVFDSADSDDEL